MIVSQVIEHLSDDMPLAPEVTRILKPGGWWYIGSVLRGQRAWWIYEREGRRLLDPTHVREYDSTEAFLAAIAHPELTVDQVGVAPFRFSVPDLAARALARAGVIRHDIVSRLYEDHPRLVQARRLRVRAPGYSLVDAYSVHHG